MNAPLRRRVLGAAALATIALGLLTPVASAHPLGNFSINHYTGLRLMPEAVIVDHVTDYAEIPTFSERRAMDTDADGTVAEAEAAAYHAPKCAALGSELALAADGRAVPLGLTNSGLSFAMGQGSLTMRLVCVYRADLPSGVGNGLALEFADNSYAARQGWREIVVETDRTTVVGGNPARESISHRLTSYPTDLLALPPDQSTLSLVVADGGAALPAPSYSDSAPSGAAEPLAATAVQPAAAVPRGVSDLGAEVTALFQAPDLTPPIVALSLAVALLLGALHALSPGHGKTVMAAYLVGSRGTARQAVGLGLTVTLSHTLGVLALGALSLSASAVLPPERLYPILSAVSGAIVICIGAYLLLARLREGARLRRRQTHEHGHSEHDHGHTTDQPAGLASPARPPGWHAHGGVGHTHLPAHDFGRRGLFALGLSGGMVPSVSALLVLVGSIAIGRPAYGILLTVAFGLGMALVLIGLGLALVHARRLVERLPLRSPLAIGQRLPVLTAAVVVLAGVLILGQGLSGLG